MTMNNKTNGVGLPDCWIPKQSKSRPNQIYYFNTATLKSQWEMPVSADTKQQKMLPKKEPAESHGKSDRSSFKMSNHSKQIKKRQSKTLAQDRLQNLTAQLTNKNTQLENAKTAQNRLRILNPQPNVAKPIQNRLRNVNTKISPASENIKRAEKSGSTADFNKSKSDNVRNTSLNMSVNNSHQTVTVATPHRVYKSQVYVSDDIPSIFPSRTPGQDRLNHIRNSLDPHNKKDQSNYESAHHSLSVIQSEFGLCSELSENNNQNATIEEDEPMDWEPCDIFERVENIVYKDFMNPYIVPDTNVFLDELSCIRDTVNRDAKYKVVVPFAVLQELDRLKSRRGDSRISNLASCAIRFIFNQLNSKTQRLQGQKATEDCMHLIDVQNADDKILNCCLQLISKSPETILISNDINLCNKAITSGITAMTSKEYKAKYN